MNCAIKSRLSRVALSTLIAASLNATAQAQSRGDDIQVTQLGDVDPFQVGINDVLPENVWSSGDASALRALLEQMPDSSQGWTSSLAARLAERALLSSGEPPRDGSNDSNLAALRADRTLASGGADLAYRLLERTPRVNTSPELARVHAEAAFASDQTEAACRTADSLLDNRDAAYWLRARAVCEVIRGNDRAAELNAELARSQSSAPVFDLYFDAATIGMELPEDIGPGSGLELALARQVNPDGFVMAGEGAPSWLVKSLAGDINPVRLSNNLDGALMAAREPETEDRLAVLEALIEQDFDLEIAAEALAIRLDIAAGEDRFVETARSYGDVIQSFPMTARTLEFGPQFIFASILSDNMQTASDWRDGVLEGPELTPFVPVVKPADENFGPARLDPERSVADGADDWTPPSAQIMVAMDVAAAIALDDLRSAGAAARIHAHLEDGGEGALTEAAALSALGAEVPAEVRAQLNRRAVDDSVAQVNAVPALLTAAAGAIGETQLHAAALLERHGLTPEALAAAVAALRVAGLESEARRLVLEAFIEEVM